MILTPEKAIKTMVHPVSYPGMVTATSNDVINAVCSVYGISREHLMLDRRYTGLTDARKLAMSLIHYNSRNSIIEKPLPLGNISILFQRTNHTTALWNCRRALYYMRYDKPFKAKAGQVCSLLNIDINEYMKHLIQNFNE